MGGGRGVERPGEAPRALLPPGSGRGRRRRGRGEGACGGGAGAEPAAHVVRGAGRFLRSLAAAGWGWGGVGAVVAVPSPSRSPLPASAEGGAPRKWRSRREVVDWLSSLVSGKICVVFFFLRLGGRFGWCCAGFCVVLCAFAAVLFFRVLWFVFSVLYGG